MIMISDCAKPIWSHWLCQDGKSRREKRALIAATRATLFQQHF